MMMKQNERALKVVALLKKEYPHLKTALNFSNPWELLIATILSAQCTDKQVNKVTPILFDRYSSPLSLGKAKQEDIEEIIKSTGFYHNKAKNIIACSAEITDKFAGQIPKNIKNMTTLSGVGRKTANVVLYNAFSKSEGIAVDTHVKRISKLLTLTKSDNPEIIERDLMKLIPRNDWGNLTHLFIAHGRKICIARRPQCSKCVLSKMCPNSN